MSFGLRFIEHRLVAQFSEKRRVYLFLLGKTPPVLLCCPDIHGEKGKTYLYPKVPK